MKEAEKRDDELNDLKLEVDALCNKNNKLKSYIKEIVTELKLKEAQKKIEILEEKLRKREQEKEFLATQLEELSSRLGQQPPEGRFRTIMNAEKFFSFISYFDFLPFINVKKMTGKKEVKFHSFG